MERDQSVFLVFGGVLHGDHEPHDIDVIVPEFNDERYVYDAVVGLESYERLACTTGKPVDLFFTTQEESFNLAGWYEPGGRWQFRQAFCGKDFFSELTPLTFEQVVDAANRGRIENRKLSLTSLEGQSEGHGMELKS